MCNSCDPRLRPDSAEIIPLLAPIAEYREDDTSALALVMWSWFLTFLLVGITTALVLTSA